jgi:hypothetical protein
MSILQHTDTCHGLGHIIASQFSTVPDTSGKQSQVPRSQFVLQVRLPHLTVLQTPVYVKAVAASPDCPAPAHAHLYC